MFVILYLHRHPLKGVRVLANPITAETVEEAQEMCLKVAQDYKAPSWIVEFEKPEIKPRLQLVSDDQDQNRIG